MFQKGFKTENKLTREALVRMKLKTKQDLVKECYLVAETTRKKRGNAGDISTCGVKKKLSNNVYCIALKWLGA